MSSNLILVSNIWKYWAIGGSPDCKSGLFGACRFEPYYFHYSTVVQRLERPTVYREGTGSSPVGTANWEDNGGCLPALDAGGRKFESCFSDDLIKSSVLEFD